MWTTEDKNLIIIDPSTWIEFQVPWGLQTYLAAMQWVPFTFLGEQPYGNCTPDGVLRIPSSTYNRVERKLIRQLRSVDGVQKISGSWKETAQNLRNICLEIEEQLKHQGNIKKDLVERLFRYTVWAKSFMAFNWLLELDPLIDEVANKSHIPIEDVRPLLLACSVPDGFPHYLEMEIALLKYALSDMERVGAEKFAEEYGYCEGYPIIPQPQEDPDAVMEHCVKLRDELGKAGLQETINSIKQSQIEGQMRRIQAKSTLLARSPLPCRPEIRAIVDAVRLAATEEEDRHLWEMRAVRNFRRLAERVGLNPTDVIEEDVLDAYRVLKMEPRGWVEKDHWPLIVACSPNE